MVNRPPNSNSGPETELPEYLENGPEVMPTIRRPGFRPDLTAGGPEVVDLRKIPPNRRGSRASNFSPTSSGPEIYSEDRSGPEEIINSSVNRKLSPSMSKKDKLIRSILARKEERDRARTAYDSQREDKILRDNASLPDGSAMMEARKEPKNTFQETYPNATDYTQNKIMPYAKGGKIAKNNGSAIHRKSKGSVVKMTRGGGVESRGKTRGKFC